MTSLTRLGRGKERSYGQATDYADGLQLYETYPAEADQGIRVHSHQFNRFMSRMRDDAIIYTLLGTTFVEAVIILVLIQHLGRRQG